MNLRSIEYNRSMVSLYRKYRPVRLEDVVGQEQVTAPLLGSLKAGKINHAYLFVGPRGCGKTSVARILAHEINGFKYEVEDDYVDIIEIDGASNRGIDDIRELREKVMIAPTTGKYKVYIIDEVHMLTKEAFNALLKTLEEPPSHVVFIMATTDAIKVPVTITSRAQSYVFKLATPDVMMGFLKDICEKEKINISDDALKIVVKRGGGSFRDSLSLLDQISTLSDKEITKEMVVSAMGLPQDENINELLSTYLTGDVVKITTMLKELLSSGIKPETLVEEMIASIVENPRVELLGLLAKLPDIKAPFPEAKLLVALTEKVGEAKIAHYSAGLELSSTSYTGAPREPSFVIGTDDSPIMEQDEPLGHVRNIRALNSNQDMLRNEQFLASSNHAHTKDFDWDGFLDRVKQKNDAIYSQLMLVSYQFTDDGLDIFPKKKVVRTILNRDNNRRVLSEEAGGVKITIHEVGEAPNEAENDETLTKISDIMGGEVQKDGGGNPFK